MVRMNTLMIVAGFLAGGASFCAYAAGDAMPASRPYLTCASFEKLMAADTQVELRRVSDPGTPQQPAYTGFFFYQCLQFDRTGRYILGMKVSFQNRRVRPTDRGEIGVIDLRDNCRWRTIGHTTAWNWQQGARLQWRPGTDEILWNDRADDGASYVCRVFNFATGASRTLPRPIYIPSPDGSAALTHDFERMKHDGTDYVGIPDRYAREIAPGETGVWRIDLNTGRTELLVSLDRMARIVYPQARPARGCLYFFREGWNPSGTRFMAFVKDPDNGIDTAFSISADGRDIRRLYNEPSHHDWRDDGHVLEGRGYWLYRDDGSGNAGRARLLPVSHNGHVSYLPRPGSDWLVSDTYAIGGYQYLFLYHIPSRLFVPLAKLRSTAGGGVFRVDLHPRFSPDGRTLCIDATHEGLGRQMYVIDISHILDNPPRAAGG